MRSIGSVIFPVKWGGGRGGRPRAKRVAQREKKRAREVSTKRRMNKRVIQS